MGEAYSLNENVVLQKDVRVLTEGSISSSFHCIPLEDIGDEEIVGILGKNGKVYGINFTGLYIIDMLKNDRTVPSICEEVENAFTSIDSVKVSEDVSAFVAELVNVGLVSVE